MNLDEFIMPSGRPDPVLTTSFDELKDVLVPKWIDPKGKGQVKASSTAAPDAIYAVPPTPSSPFTSTDVFVQSTQLKRDQETGEVAISSAWGTRDLADFLTVAPTKATLSLENADLLNAQIDSPLDRFDPSSARHPTDSAFPLESLAGPPTESVFSTPPAIPHPWNINSKATSGAIGQIEASSLGSDLDGVESRLADIADRLERAAGRLDSPPSQLGVRPRTFRGRIDG